MSQENVEVVQRSAEAFNSRDMSAALKHFDREVEWAEDPRYPGAETFRGPSGVERSIRKWWDAWGEITMNVEETIDLGDRVVISGHTQARGHNSEVSVTAPFGGAWEFRDGKVVRVQVFASRAEALEAVGLSD